MSSFVSSTLRPEITINLLIKRSLDQIKSAVYEIKIGRKKEWVIYYESGSPKK